MARSHLTGGPFSGSVTYNNALNNGVPLFSFPSPFLTSGTAAVQNVNGVNPNLKSPYTQQWNFTIERQVASYRLADFVRGRQSDQLVYQRNLNLPLPSTIPFTTSRRPNQLFNHDHLLRQRRHGRVPRPGVGGAKALWPEPHLQHRLHLGQGPDRHPGFRRHFAQRLDFRRPAHPESERPQYREGNQRAVVPHRFFAYAV